MLPISLMAGCIALLSPQILYCTAKGSPKTDYVCYRDVCRDEAHFTRWWLKQPASVIAEFRNGAQGAKE